MKDRILYGLKSKTTKVRPRDFQIRKEDAERLGYSRSCGGCSSWFKGRSRQPHTEDCRERFRKLLADEARVQYAAEKRREFDEKMEDRAWKKLARKQELEGQGGYSQVGGSSSSGEPQLSGKELTPASGGGDADHVNEGEVLSGDTDKSEKLEKRGAEDNGEGTAGAGKRMRLMDNSDMDALEHFATDYNISEVGQQVMCRDARTLLEAIQRWVQEIGKAVEEQVEVEEKEEWIAWDDVRGGTLNAKDVKAARQE